MALASGLARAVSLARAWESESAQGRGCVWASTRALAWALAWALAKDGGWASSLASASAWAKEKTLAWDWDWELVASTAWSLALGWGKGSARRWAAEMAGLQRAL